ncbi:hypothetical protein PCE1_000757 [Barthelona sp. PCE]
MGKNKKKNDKDEEVDPEELAFYNSMEWKNFNKGDMKQPLTEESSFSLLFPSYREEYLKANWGLITKELDPLGIEVELDLLQGTIYVRTTRKTWDPYVIIKARDMMKLLSRSVTLDMAKLVLKDDVFSDVIQIRNIVKNRERFVKRRQRLIGPNGSTLKALEVVTGCYVVVQGGTVCAIGPFDRLSIVRQIVLDCMNNVHPIYNIREQMLKNELAKNEDLKHVSWDKFLPQYKKRNERRKSKKVVTKDRRTEGPKWPTAPQPRKEDIAMATGEYWLSKEELEKKERWVAKKSKNNRQEKRVAAPDAHKRQIELEKRGSGNETTGNDNDFLQNLKKKRTQQ